ncbi:hypothetical protein Ddye_023735 [Dipteronia dyeriana]|uniref:tryptophan--tRNA ligase n=1 Tax=Dipteronia dyeriana TaxID=168575 RepID=A0AAD9WTL7_9ROSI|nr:hypothetical protein Ddye_023735 [Dipteronia dyeriana]
MFGSMHLGDLIPFMLSKYLQDAFKVPLVIQLSDDENCLGEKHSIKESRILARENAKSIIAFGFDITRTFIFCNSDYMRGAFYRNMVKVSKCIECDEAMGSYGIAGEDPIGKVGFSSAKAAPSFSSSFPHLFSGEDHCRCLIPCAIDEDANFRMIRGVASEIGYCKPALIESSIFPALQGENGDPNSAIYVTDSVEVNRNKINRYAFSGGQGTVELHRKVGANLEVDVPIKYLSFFLEDDMEFECIKREYGAGRMLGGEVKQRLIQVLVDLVERHQKARAAVTDEMVDEFMAKRPLVFN